MGFDLGGSLMPSCNAFVSVDRKDIPVEVSVQATFAVLQGITSLLFEI